MHVRNERPVFAHELIHSRRIPAKKRQVRDLILHVLRETGLYTNEEIGGVVGLTHSAISRQARKIQSEIQHNKELKRQYDRLKSKIKL
jgi:chromosomal replication initiation ATPase DnaA